MRKFAVILLALALALTGCAAPGGSSSAEPSSTEALTETDVLSAYDTAAEVYDWFDLCAPPTTGDAILIDGNDYYQVNVDGLSTYAELESRVHASFAPALAEKILAGDEARSVAPFRDVNGKLCTRAGARGENLYLVGKTMEAERVDDAHWTLTLTFYGDSYEFDRPAATIGYTQRALDYEKTADGWHFTNFCPTDDFDWDCGTVFTFTYDDVGFAALDDDNCSDLELACWLLHSDGAYSEGPGDTLTERFLADPDAWFSTLSVFVDSPWEHAKTVMVWPAYSAAAGWFTAEQTAQFQDILDTYQPKNESEQLILDTLKTTYQEAKAENDASRVTPEQEFSLAPLRSSTADFPENQPFPQSLQLGIQKGSYPWGCDGLSGTPKKLEGCDYGQGYEVVSGNLTLRYYKSDGVDVLTSMTTVDSSPATSLWTRRGARCGDLEADLLTHYASDELTFLDEEQIPAPRSTVTDYDGAWVYEQSTGCKHISFYTKDGVVCCIELEDLLDGQLLPH